MKLALRIAAVLVVGVGVGLLTFHGVMTHAVHQPGAYLPEARLGAMMGGLFAGGIAATIVLLALFLRPSGKPE